MKKVFLSVVSVMTLLGLGVEVARHESQSRIPAVGKITLGNVAWAQTLERGFADLAKKTNPGVVNISTYARPRVQPYGRGGGQDEMFRRFFEDFFGSRVAPGQGGPRGDVGPDDEEGEEDGPMAEGPGPRGSKTMPMALGTGFVIDANEGLILTNFHVLQGAEEVKVQFKEDDLDLIPAEIIGKDPELDVALLKVKTKKLVALPLGDSDAIEVGEYVLAIGNPLGYGHTVSHGIISAKGRHNPEFRMGLYLQTDASINPGNSGGPLVNTKGEVVGINNAIDARAHGIGFAIPINLVKGILPQLKTKGTVSRGFLGVSAIDMTPEVAQQLKLDAKTQGVLVADVSPNAPASKAGIKPYDIVLSVNGEKVRTAQDLTDKIVTIPVGNKAKVAFLRDGKENSAEVQIAERPVQGVTPRPVKAKEKASNGSATFDAFGFRAQELSPQEAIQLGIPGDAIKGRKPVIVSDLEYGKAASNSGLDRGDWILDVANREIKSLSDLEKAFKIVKGNAVMMRVKRFDSRGNDFVSVVVLTK